MRTPLRIFVITVLCVLLVFSLSGCFASGKTENANSNPNPLVDNNEKNGDSDIIPDKAGDEPVSNEEQAGKNPGLDDQKQGDGVKGQIINDNYPSEITKFLEDNKKKETQQAFNINNKTYLVLTMGQQSSAGYSIELKELILKDSALKVYVKYQRPKKDAVVATVLTYPCLVIETDDIYEGHYEIFYDIEK